MNYIARQQPPPISYPPSACQLVSHPPFARQQPPPVRYSPSTVSYLRIQNFRPSDTICLSIHPPPPRPPLLESVSTVRYPVRGDRGYLAYTLIWDGWTDTCDLGC